MIYADRRGVRSIFPPPQRLSIWTFGHPRSPQALPQQRQALDLSALPRESHRAATRGLGLRRSQQVGPTQSAAQSVLNSRPSLDNLVSFGDKVGGSSRPSPRAP